MLMSFKIFLKITFSYRNTSYQNTKVQILSSRSLSFRRAF